MSNIPILGEKKQTNEPQFRLLYCLVCQTLEELPPYEGAPEKDYLKKMHVNSMCFLLENLIKVNYLYYL
jgi:hypothetical protein